MVNNLHYKFVKPSDIHSNVRVSRFAPPKRRRKIDGKLTLSKVRQLMSSSSNQSGSIGKDERKYYLQLLIENRMLRDAAHASKILNVSESTIKKYLRELNLSFD